MYGYGVYGYGVSAYGVYGYGGVSGYDVYGYGVYGYGVCLGMMCMGLRSSDPSGQQKHNVFLIFDYEWELFHWILGFGADPGVKRTHAGA